MHDNDLIELTTYQKQVWEWAQRTFEDVSAWDDPRERAFRFLEEAVELFQAAGMSLEDAEDVLDYVFIRDKGEVRQEIGGVMVTLLAFASRNNIDVGSCLRDEYSRIQRPEVQQCIREKQIAKNKEMF